MIWRSRAKILGSEAKILLPDPFAPQRGAVALFVKLRDHKIITDLHTA